MNKWFVGVVLPGTLAIASFSAVTDYQPVRNTFHALQQELAHRYKEKDYAAARRSMQALYELAHRGSRVTVDLAGANALAGHRDEALRLLSAAADMGISADVLSDGAFISLQDHPRLQKVQSKLDANRAPVSNSSPITSLSDPTLLTEDVTYDHRTGTYFLSSIRQKKVVRIGRNGNQTTFADLSKDPAWPLAAIAVDSERRVLWVTAVAQPNFAFTPKADEGRSTLLKLNADTGELLARFDVPADRGAGALIGDMTLLADGSLVISDGRGGAVYHFIDGTYLRMDSGQFISPQTPAATPDGHYVFVPDYVRGLARIDLKTREIVWLKHPERLAVDGVDGMYLRGHDIIAVQNGTLPERLVRFHLNPAMDNIDLAQVLEANTPGLGELTHGVFTPEGFVFIANSGWDQIGAEGVLNAKVKATPPALWKLDIAKEKH